MFLSEFNAFAYVSTRLVSETELYRNTESVHLPLHRPVVMKRDRGCTRGLVDEAELFKRP